MDYTPQGYEFWRDRRIRDSHRDWNYGGKSWITDYVLSVEHPHRSLIIEALKTLEPYESLLEIGCSAGPNLLRIHGKKLAGIDANAKSIEAAKTILPDVDLRVGNMIELPWNDKSFDILLADASLMYISPEDIDKMMKEIDRVTKKGVVIIDRFNESLNGEVGGYVWARNYPRLLEIMGFKVTVKKITEELWPDSKNWQLYGVIVTAKR